MFNVFGFQKQICSLGLLLHRIRKGLLLGRRQRNAEDFGDGGCYLQVRDVAQIDTLADVRARCDEERLHIAIAVEIAMRAARGCHILLHWLNCAVCEGVAWFRCQIQIRCLIG